MSNLMNQINEVITDLQNNDADYKVILNTLIDCKEALAQPLTRDWKETIDERVAKDDAFKRALEQPVVMERDYNFMRDLAIGCEDAWNELHKQEPVGYIDKEQLYRWERLRGTPYEAPERAYIGFSKIPFKSDLTDCSLAVYTHPCALARTAPSWQGEI